MDTLERGLARARQFTMHGAYLAELTIPTDDLITCQRTTRTEGHYTLHGSADAILACVTRVIPVGVLEEGES